MYRPQPTALLGPLSLALLASACAGPGGGDRAVISSLRAPIQDGSEAAGRSNVVGLQGIVKRDTDGTLRTLLCTGTLIAPNLVLTARHCISRVADSQVTCGKAAFSAPLSPRDIFVTTEDEMPTNPSRYLDTREVLVPDEGNDVCGFDVALVVLRENVPAAVARPIEPRLDDAVGAEEAYRAVGYGATSGNGDGEGASGVRRERAGLKASCVEGAGSDCPLSNGSEWEGQAGVCEGDSGGPALDEAGRVIGVASRSVFDGPNQERCLTPVYGAVAGWRDWIREVARDAARQGGYEAATWVTATGGSVNGGGQPTGGSDAADGPSGGQDNGSSDDGGGCAVRAPGPGRGAGAALWLAGASLALAARGRRRGRVAG